MSSDSPSTHGPGLKARLGEELRKYLAVCIYLYVWFGALMLYKTTLMTEPGLHYLPLGFAAAKALIIGKFLLMGESARIGSRLKSRTLLQLIAHRILLLFALVVVLSVVEEFLVGWAHGHSFARTLAEYEQRSLAEMLATSLLVLLILTPLVAINEVNRALGPGMLRHLLLSPPAKPTSIRDDAGDPRNVRTRA